MAAKVTRTDENGSWILAYVLRFYPDSETYDVQDEDDKSLFLLPVEVRIKRHNIHQKRRWVE